MQTVLFLSAGVRKSKNKNTEQIGVVMLWTEPVLVLSTGNNGCTTIAGVMWVKTVEIVSMVILSF